MRLRGNTRGIAMGVVLILSLVALAISTGLLYLIALWSNVSAMEKSYRTAYEAGVGGVEVTKDMIDMRGAPSIPGLVNLTLPDNACLNAKMNQPTAAWGAACDSSSVIATASDNSYDMRFDLGNYRVYSKIVDTVIGNSAATFGLDPAPGVTSTGTGDITVVSMPYLYTIEILSENIARPNEERSKISVLYQY